MSRGDHRPRDTQALAAAVAALPTWIVHGVDTDTFTQQRRRAPEPPRRALDRHLPSVNEGAEGAEDAAPQERSAGDALSALAAIQYEADEASQQVLREAPPAQVAAIRQAITGASVQRSRGERGGQLKVERARFFAGESYGTG